MCGILAVISPEIIDQQTREYAYQRSRLQRHRGPDESGIVALEKAVLIHERLALVCEETGLQPFVSKDDRLVLSANCEIYNWKDIVSLHFSDNGKAVSVRSDAEVIMQLYDEYDTDSLQYLQGMFSFVLYDKERDCVFIARDPVGILPLYMGYDSSKRLWLSSELKCLIGVCDQIQSFKPGTYAHGNVSSLKFVEYYSPEWRDTIPDKGVDVYDFQTRLMYEIETHLPYASKVASLLSGGLDSSIIASVAQSILEKSGRHLSTYSIGIEGSPDLVYARMVAKHIGSKHVEVHFTPEQGVDSIKEMIWHLETYDVTTIRAGIPMYLLARRVKKDGFKAILSGEGADEIFGGYLYFHQAPSAEEFHRETVSRVMNISYADCLRANKSTMAWGLELRVPFLSSSFIDYAMNIAPEVRMIPSSIDTIKRPCEKFLLRYAFSDDFLPKAVLWRQKEQFSDGVGYGWIDRLKHEAEQRISDAEFSTAAELFPYNSPQTKEAFYYRKLFHEMFGSSAEKTIKTWVPRTDWGCHPDPSGRTQHVHINRVPNGSQHP